jgi:choline-sulfatase
MIRTARYKYVHYVGYPPQLFDLDADPEETRDLGTDPAHADVRAACERELRAICDPEAVDRRARADQRRRLEAAGGPAAVLAEGVKIPYTPAPAAFEPAPVEARERSRRTARLDATPGGE